MKKYLFLAILALFAFASCVEDNSSYDPQDKENVVIDDYSNEQKNSSDSLPDGVLVPGIHLVKLNVTQPDGQTVERRFKYFMPISIDPTRPISLIFEFHGSYTFAAGVAPSDPLQGITVSNPLIQNAIQNNCVVCFPAGTVETQADGSGAVNWQYSEKHLPFVDAMIDYFESRTPTIDKNRIYSTGQSSGSIFSFVLAFERSNVFAAITPRAGQMKIADDATLPSRAVPIRLFQGTDDDIVQHNAAVSNMSEWARRIGGYFDADMQLTEDSFEIEGYKKVDTRIWSGGRTDYQVYSLEEEGHGVSLYYCMPYMWEFMSNHTLNSQADGPYLTCSRKEIDAMCGQSFTVNVNYTDGAQLEVSRPKGWTVSVKGKTINVTTPQNYYASISRHGNISLTVTKDGKSVTKEIAYKLQAPKNYFEVGDIYFNSNFEPVGIVCWVNDDNIQEAKIISLQEVTSQGTYKNIQFGDFGNFTTPDENDGEGNTAKHVKQNSKLASPLDNQSSGLIWAATYSYKGVGGWYLPAINELKAVEENFDVISQKMQEAGGDEFFMKKNNSYLSSTVTAAGNSSKGSKTFHMYSFANKAESTQTRNNTSYYYARAMKNVKK